MKPPGPRFWDSKLGGRAYQHLQPSNFLSRTVMVKDNNVEEAAKILNGIVSNEGIMQRWKLTRRWGQRLESCHVIETIFSTNY